MPSMDIGIDLGTANIMITMDGKGIVLDEPSVVAFNKKTNQVVAVGTEAYKMLGRTPEYIVAVRPLSDGVISDHNMTESMIKEFILKVCGKQLFMPRIIICVPSLITDVESRAVVEAARNAGARKVYLIQEPVAALLGAGIDISLPNGNMVVDIGGGTTDVAVISLNGIVKAASLKLAGNKIDQAIIRYISNQYKILIGEKTAETAKKNITNIFEPTGNLKMTVKGRHLLKGLPESIEISDIDVFNAIEDPVNDIVNTIKSVLEVTPPELIGDIYTNGIVLTGGGALLTGLDKYITAKTGVKCYAADDPISCVARGTGNAFKLLDQLLDGFESIPLYKY
ncbi:MAG TPA: rod shape-determining protein [Oscillospiraceae bacterium]|nr:rod shape-determining protein [Oscillospiraceae bacterium]